jgi:Kef-type K+ transport system membrane component KefB
MADLSVQSLVLVAAIAVIAPICVSFVSRWLVVPVVVFEIAFGILLGPQMAGWIKDDPYIHFLGELGLAMLFLITGYEIDFAAIRGRPLKLSIIGWTISLVIGVALGLLLAPSAAAGVMVGICLTSTAIGTIHPMLRDEGELRTEFGSAVLAIGASGEFGPLIAVALFLSEHSPGRASVILTAFAILIGVSLYLASRYEHVRLHRLIESSLHTSSQFGVRLVILILAALAGLAAAFGLDMLLGAFAAGVLLGLLLRSADPTAVGTVETKLDAVGFGFLVPIFFINTGVTFDIKALFHHWTTLALVPTFVILFVLVRGIPAVIAAPRGAPPIERASIALLAATGLPIIVAVTTIGVADGELESSTAAALVGAGMLSVLILPLIALALRRRQRRAAIAPS